MPTKNRNIKYGNKDVLSPDEFDPANVKARITTFVDLDVLLALKKLATKRHTKYQTLLNAALRDYVEETKKSPLTESRVRRIIKEELRKRA